MGKKIIFSKDWFFDLDATLRAAGLDSDSESFDIILARLRNKDPLSSDEFARQAIYVVLAGGFSQKTAKIIHKKIMDFLAVSPQPIAAPELIKLFNNKNKINAVIEIWENKDKFRNGYYKINEQLSISNEQLLQKKLDYLSSLPHIGKITANHLARNLGEDIVKYDIWIQRLGALFNEQLAISSEQLKDEINNQQLAPKVKAACDEMFAHLVMETGLPRGYIDVVLWKACQVGYINFNNGDKVAPEPKVQADECEN
ncbi:MAG: hypothetical protein LBJ18_03845 [Rickettsiales bacterium]|jgi:hypothetical protein|nr:hypothetical protein [Rickettsiales bacterium]